MSAAAQALAGPPGLLRTPLRRYGLAVAVTALTCVSGYGIDLGRAEPLGFEPYLIPIALSAVLGGIGPGLASVLFSLAGGWIWTVSNMITVWGPWEWFGLVTAGVMLVVLFDRVRRASEALVASERRCSAILESASDGIVTVDEHDVVIGVNASAERIFGWPAAAIVGKPLSLLVPERFRAEHARLIASFAAASRDPAGTSGPNRPGIVGLRASGEEFLIEASISRADVGGQTVLTAIVRDLTEHQRAEEALRDRDFKLRLFLESAPASIAMYDRDLRLVLASDGWAKAMGLVPDDVVGKRLADLLPHIPAKWKAAQERCLAGATERGEEELLLRADGPPTWFSWEMRPWYTPSGGVGGIVAMGWDVTDRKRAADALHESEERWRSLVELLPDPLFVSEGGRIVYMNQRGLELWRAEHREQILGRAPSDLLHPDERAELAERIRTAADGVPTSLWVTRILALDGTVIPVESTANVQVKDGRRFAQVVVRDVSQRRAAEEQLRFQEALLRDMGRMAHVGGWTVDVETGNEFWTEEMPRIYDKGPAAPMTMQDRVAMFDGEAQQKVSAAVDGVLSHGLSYEVEVPLVTGAGNAKWIRSIGQPVMEDGRVVGIRAACQDVTEQHAASDRIRRLNEELEARVEARTAELKAANGELEAFSYSVSHDLRAPLRTMDGFAEMLQSDFGDQLPAEAVRCTRVIRESAQRMGSLIDDLLAFSRLGRERLRPADVDMRALVEETLGELRPACGDRRIEVDVAELCPCRGDRALLKQVWTNLLSNALKYTRPRHTARIAVGCTADGAGTPTYFVRDNGVGFDTKYADKLFGVFQRLHRVTDFEGTGVGLAIVHRIISRHGGRVWCEAEEGQGATFFFNVWTEEAARADEAEVAAKQHREVVTAA